MTPAFVESISRMAHQGPPDLSAWTDEQTAMRDHVRRLLVDFIDEIRRGGDTSTRRGTCDCSSEQEVTVSTARTSARICAIRHDGGPTRALVHVLPLEGPTAQIEFPVERLDIGEVPDADAPRLSMIVAEAGFYQLQHADLVAGDPRLDATRRVLMVHCARLRHTTGMESHAVLDLIARFPDGAAAEVISVADLLGKNLGARETLWRSADHRPACPSPGHARIVELTPTVLDGRSVTTMEIESPRMDVDDADMPDDPVEIARLIRDPSVPQLVQANP